MRTMILMLALALVPSLSGAHEPGKREPATMTVSATGTVAASPDTAFVSFGVETAGKSLAEAQRQNRTLSNLVETALLQVVAATGEDARTPPKKRRG